VVCLIDTSAAKPSGNAPAKEEAKPVAEAPKAEVIAATPKPAPVAEKTYAASAPSPAARKILDEKNIQPSAIVGTGKDGRITKDDAVNAVPSMGTPAGGSRGSERTKLSMLRRKVAERLVAAKNETAMLTTFNEVNMTPINLIRNEYKDAFKAKHGGLGLGYMSFFTKAVTRALAMYPDVNSMIDGDFKTAYDFCDISIAVSGPKGLMVPVVRNAENLSFRGIEAEIKRLAIKSRDGQITVDDMTGGTFTITNGGVFGSMLSTPIINPPQSGILGMHNIIERPIAVNGKVEIHPMMYVALSYDHRIIDGRESVGFLVAVKEALENPMELLMENNPKRTLEL
jgi:2-oxoglutarate dehydrogenase E2 component (dihydrolipoamide succinyltransferase)